MALLESAQVVEALVRVALLSPILALRGTAFFALNLVAMTTAGVNILSRLGKSDDNCERGLTRSTNLSLLRLGLNQAASWRTVARFGRFRMELF